MKPLSAIVLIFVMIVMTVAPAAAYNTADAKEPLDWEKECSLTLTFQYDEAAISGIEAWIYRIVAFGKDGGLVIAEPYESYRIDLSEIGSETDWNDIAVTADSYIVADKKTPESSGTTDENGVVRFDHLENGIYLVRTENKNTDFEGVYFKPFMIAVPGIDENGKWQYDTEAFPKPSGERQQQESYDYNVVKEWRDGKKSGSRPDHVNIEIYCDGELSEKITLDASVNWTYAWSSQEYHQWTVVEREVPGDYYVQINEKDGTYIVTNILNDEPDHPPVTGDSSNFYIIVILMTLVGLGLVFTATRLRTRKDEE